MNFDKESKSETKKNVVLKVGRGGGGGRVEGDTETKTVSQTVKRVKNETTIICMWYNQHFKIHE